MLTLQQAEESIRAKRDTQEKKETKVIETGSPPLVSKSTTISVDSEGAVNINPPKEEKSDGQVLTAEILTALSEIKNHRNSDQTSTFEESVEIDFYKKMSYMGGLFFIAVAIACLLMVRALKALRQESYKWGFDPKTVGRSAHKMFKMIEGVDSLISRESSSLVNELSKNNMSDDAKSQMERQIMKLNEMKKILERVDNIQRTHFGS